MKSFEIFDILWAKKMLIIGLGVFFALSGWLFATFHPGKPDKYVYTALLQIGRYTTQSGEIRVLESPNDLALVLNHLVQDVKGSVPRGGESLIILEAAHVNSEVSMQLLGRALSLIKERHDDFAKPLGEHLIYGSDLVLEPVLTTASIKNSRSKIVFVAAFFGLLIGVGIVLFVSEWERSRKGEGLQ